MTPGQIRYYFPNHSELLNLMSTVELKVRRRIEAIFKSENLTTIDKAKASLLTVLPLDKERLVIWKFGWRFAMTYMSTVKVHLMMG